VRHRVLVAVASAVVLAPAASAAAATTPSAPQVVTTVRDTRITESSGLAMSVARRDVVWTVNDSGAAAVVYGVSTRTGRTVATLRLVDDAGRPAEVVDTESLAGALGADGRRSLLVADIGDNRRVRGSVALLRVPEPTSVHDATLRVARLALTYEGGPVDAEALVATSDGRLLVIAKAVLWADVYEVPPAAARRLLAGHSATVPVEARRVTRIGQSLVTGADALPDGRIVVRGYGSATTYRWDGGDLVADQDVELPSQQQGESIAVEADGRTALVSSEGVRQPLYRVNLPAASASASAAAAATASPTSPARSVRATPTRAGAPGGDGGDRSALLGVGLGVALALAGGSVLAVRGARRRSRRRL
jgi:hypothetical protein